MISQRGLHFGHHIRHTRTEAETQEHVPAWLQEEALLETKHGNKCTFNLRDVPVTLLQNYYQLTTHSCHATKIESSCNITECRKCISF